MPHEHLQDVTIPKLNEATMLLALTGWMDGGFVSTGTVRSLMADREVKEIARINSDPFYIYNFPGSMEIAALFRPTVRYQDGLIAELQAFVKQAIAPYKYPRLIEFVRVLPKTATGKLRRSELRKGAHKR